ncbi:2-oxo acid dehydrogenase subunit E2 [Saccharopolyspora sp. ASAGF58]|uniref:2-oxo acid dehydrogenase subunit E2 n=1 Tax=Saccharopolyspora sp. ASAGF58 TaxID=2719023 RepID=UPI001FF08F86|nr:2-oxo acid dehydrogenase subunit E2 [Saccharopolyspora sp. ASAGF58]
MSTHVTMPALGENVTEAFITRWLKRAGDTVAADEPLLEVATDKVDTEVPAPFAGTIHELLAKENDTVAVGEPLAIVEPAGAGPASHSDAPPAPEPVTPPAVPTVTEPAPAPAVTATAPAVTATAPAVTATAPAVTATAPADDARVEKMSRLRQTIATRMVASLQGSAQLTTVLEADVTTLARLRARTKDAFEARTGTRLSFLPFFAKGAIEALREHPMLNASVSDDNTTATYHSACHLGIAVDTPRGLMVPVIRDADRLDVEGLAVAIADVAGRTRDGRISPDELAGGTFTITNTGSRGALFDTPILNPPQTGILGTGAIVERVVPRPDGTGGHTIAVRSMAYLSVSYDHRLVDGADAARFLSTIKNHIERADFSI